MKIEVIPAFIILGTIFLNCNNISNPGPQQTAATRQPFQSPTNTGETGNGEAYLSNIGFSTGFYYPAFAPGLFAGYYGYIPASVESVTILIQESIPVTFEISVNGISQGVVKLISINTGENQVTIKVTSENKETQHTYHFILNRGILPAAYLKGTNLLSGDLFGQSMAIDGNNLVIGAPGDHAGGDNPYSGAVYVFRNIDNQWVQTAYLKAVNAGESDGFGGSVDISGDIIIAGAEGEDNSCSAVINGTGITDNNDAENSGAAYIFRQDVNGAWVFEAYLKPSNSEAGDLFGHCVALYQDTAVAGAYEEDSNQYFITHGNGIVDNNTASNAGAAYVFGKAAGNWHQEAYLKASNAEVDDNFGCSADLWGNTLVIGAKQEEGGIPGVSHDINTAGTDNTEDLSGAAYVYNRNGSTWSQQAYLKASNTQADHQFGHQVAIYEDTIVVGSMYEDSQAPNGGAAYIFSRSADLWSQAGLLHPFNPDAGDNFGRCVAVFNDTIVIGADHEDSDYNKVMNGNFTENNNAAPDSGAVYVYKKQDNQWNCISFLKAPNIESNAMFGYGAALSANTIVCSTPYESSQLHTSSYSLPFPHNNEGLYVGAVYTFLY